MALQLTAMTISGRSLTPPRLRCERAPALRSGVSYDGNQSPTLHQRHQRPYAGATAILDQTSGSLMIGVSQYGEYLQDLIDEVRILIYARSGAQIVADMNIPINL